MKNIEIRDVDEVFENAIMQGMNDTSEWMYMYSDINYDYFKNIDDRHYKRYARYGFFERCKRRLFK